MRIIKQKETKPMLFKELKTGDVFVFADDKEALCLRTDENEFSYVTLIDGCTFDAEANYLEVILADVTLIFKGLEEE